ncbi:MAG: LysM peptidoglycan-binding domain-containing protein [Sandaracinaceae bacterium]|nr:LysM peptidoglycan-binding domain-containing protein [Sandaracinaceae bacterium]
MTVRTRARIGWRIVLFLLAWGEGEVLQAQLGPEREELRLIREFERELFPRRDPLIDLRQVERGLGGVPPSLRDDLPSPQGDERATSPAIDNFRDLALPDLPVRWDERVLRYLEFFQNDPRGQMVLRRWFAKMGRFEAFIREELRQAGLPEDLVYVAMVESGFEPRARSEAGAVGLWQFMAHTGSAYGLDSNHWTDWRLDPFASTRAAIRYLAALHERLGTWELALAAYNMGYSALVRSVIKYGTNDFWLLARLEAALPYETVLYVAKVQACAIAGRNPERFGLNEVIREPPWSFEVVEVPGGIPFSLIARAVDASVEEIRRLNPAFRRDRTPPGETLVSVRVPVGGAQRFAERWPRLCPEEPAHAPYTVRYGESLGMIAARFGMSEQALRELNGLSQNEPLRPGTLLLVPVRPSAPSPLAEAPVVVVPARSFNYPNRKRVFYRVGPGERLSEIARRFGVSPEEIVEWNEIDPRAALPEGFFLQLFIGSDLDTGRIFVLSPEEVRVLIIGSEEHHAFQAEQSGRIRFRYEVREGENLETIARRFGTSAASLSRINRIPRNAKLPPGQLIVVYASPQKLPPALRATLLRGGEGPKGGEGVSFPARNERDVELARIHHKEEEQEGMDKSQDVFSPSTP